MNRKSYLHKTPRKYYFIVMREEIWPWIAWEYGSAKIRKRARPGWNWIERINGTMGDRSRENVESH